MKHLAPLALLSALALCSRSSATNWLAALSLLVST